MFDRGSCELITWHTYRDRLRDAEERRLARQARTRLRLRFHHLAWAPVQSERHPSLPVREWQGHLPCVVREATAGSEMGGGLNL